MSQPTEALTASVKTMAASIEAMREQLTTSNTTISNLSVRLTTRESLLKSTQAENATLKEELAASALESTQLKAKLNHLEQHHRSWSVRVTGLNIPTADETDSNRVKHHLYEQLYDDLTRVNFQKMKAIGDDKRVDSCWSANGQLKFKLVGSQQVRNVSSVFASIDKIVS